MTDLENIKKAQEIMSRHTHRCPVCNFTCEYGAGIFILFYPDSRYCPKCYAEWAIKHVPKLEDIPEEEQKGTHEAEEKG